jgi:hypothetical protein
MRRVDQLLARDPFRIDMTACDAASQVIRAFRGDQVIAPWAKLTAETQFLFKLSFISICHQINWDFLQSRLALHLLADGGGALLGKITNASAKDVGQWLEGYEKPERIRAVERAEILRNLGETIERELQGVPMQLFDASEGMILGDKGFLKQLERFKAYREDPLLKKSNVLLQELTRERILRFKDESAIQPAIDYHIMRLYLRTGRVIPIDLEIKDLFKGSPTPRPLLVKRLRETVGMALDLTAFYAGLPVSEVNFIEWQIGRAVCKTDAPGCVTQVRDPALDETVARLFQGPCPYIGCCHAFIDPEWRALREPELKKSFY